jgi:hypothetical protein
MTSNEKPIRRRRDGAKIVLCGITLGLDTAKDGARVVEIYADRTLIGTAAINPSGTFFLANVPAIGRSFTIRFAKKKRTKPIPKEPEHSK